jgi:hypothetical protein
MKNLALLIVLISFSLVAQAQQNRKIQLVILFDASNSMDGLLDQAKSKIWAIVNDASGLRYQGTTPVLEIAMYDYGNAGISSVDNYVRMQTNFTTDLDLISSKLFGIRTNGGEEYCGAAIQKSLQQLNWSNDPKDLKLIYIAGNEPFNQGPVSYKEVCNEILKKDVIVNTIYCGDYQQGIREFWKDGATCSNGAYFNINSNDKITSIATPYDDEIFRLNQTLNSTYISYGFSGNLKKESQLNEDKNALNQNISVASERAIVKSKGSYNNASWDIVDAYRADSTSILDLEGEAMPAELKGKSDEDIKKYIADKTIERSTIQAEIVQLALLRDDFIAKEKSKLTESGKKDDFGTAMSKSIKEKGKEKGFE